MCSPSGVVPPGNKSFASGKCRNVVKVTPLQQASVWYDSPCLSMPRFHDMQQKQGIANLAPVECWLICNQSYPHTTIVLAEFTQFDGPVHWRRSKALLGSGGAACSDWRAV